MIEDFRPSEVILGAANGSLYGLTEQLAINLGEVIFKLSLPNIRYLSDCKKKKKTITDPRNFHLNINGMPKAEDRERIAIWDIPVWKKPLIVIRKPKCYVRVGFNVRVCFSHCVYISHFADLFYNKDGCGWWRWELVERVHYTPGLLFPLAPNQITDQQRDFI